MKVCKYCNHIALGKQEIQIYRALLIVSNKTTKNITEKTNRVNNTCYAIKTVRQILYRLEKHNLIERKIHKKERSFLWYSKRSCSLCKSFKFLTAFNTWSCIESKGLYWYCNNYNN